MSPNATWDVSQYGPYQFQTGSGTHHADCLPDAKHDPRRDTTVQTLQTILLVDVLERSANTHVLGSVGILLLALHLDADDLDRLIPGTQTTTKSTRDNLLGRRELLARVLASQAPDLVLGQTRQTKARAPIGDLTNSDGIYSLVDARDTLSAVNVHEGRHCTRRLDPRCGSLVLGDLDRLHTGAETHGCVRLSETADHASGDAGSEGASSKGAGIILRLGGYEEKDGAFGRGFNPGPWNQTLVDCMGQKMQTRDSRSRDIQPRGPPRPQIRPMAPPKLSPRLAAMVVFATSSGCRDYQQVQW